MCIRHHVSTEMVIRRLSVQNVAGAVCILMVWLMGKLWRTMGIDCWLFIHYLVFLFDLFEQLQLVFWSVECTYIHRSGVQSAREHRRYFLSSSSKYSKYNTNDRYQAIGNGLRRLALWESKRPIMPSVGGFSKIISPLHQLHYQQKIPCPPVWSTFSCLE